MTRTEIMTEEITKAADGIDGTVSDLMQALNHANSVEAPALRDLIEQAAALSHKIAAFRDAVQN